VILWLPFWQVWADADLRESVDEAGKLIETRTAAETE
jgi:hypothetical protein